MTKKKIKVSDNIKMLRESLNYSQEFVAAKLEMSQQAYSLIENNPEKTSLKNLRAIARVLNVNISILILEDEQLNLTSNDAYEKLISKLENEIVFLRNLIEKQSVKSIS